MNKQQIRENYLKCIEPDIAMIERYADDSRLDILLEVCNSCYGYGLFYPITCGFVSGGQIEFTSLCVLFKNLIYHIEDDGALSLVQTELSLKYDDELTKTAPDLGELLFYETFITMGFHNELDEDSIYKTATVHGFENSKLKSYVATRFSWETLDFLHSLCPRWKEISVMGSVDCGNPDSESYFDAREEMEKVFKDYIISQKYHTEKKFKV